MKIVKVRAKTVSKYNHALKLHKEGLPPKIIEMRSGLSSTHFDILRAQYNGQKIP